jgi:heptosyltransferase-2
LIDRPRVRILLVHLGAMGAVVRSTSLLAAIKRKFPSSHLTWVTQAPMHLLLQGHPRIDRVLTTSLEDQLALRALNFDVAFVIDKSLAASGVLRMTQADLVYGFVADPHTGAILPATPAADELWRLGLDNDRKFFVNKKPETQLQIESLELGPFQRDDYDLPLSSSEEAEVKRRHSLWSLRSDQPVIGFNTGCGPLMPAKKWTIEFHREVLQTLLGQGLRNLVLLGGPEDEERNGRIGAGLPVLQSACRSGLRDGLLSVGACDLVVTGDSLGMHLAIARKRFVIAWFGPSCSHEIDLYDRGVALKTTLGCSPCWKRRCAQNEMCYDHISREELQRAFERGLDWWNRTTQHPPQVHPSPL